MLCNASIVEEWRRTFSCVCESLPLVLFAMQSNKPATVRQVVHVGSRYVGLRAIAVPFPVGFLSTGTARIHLILNVLRPAAGAAQKLKIS